MTGRHRVGSWPILELREAQCRFACTADDVQPHQHLFCGRPVAWLKGKPTRWCGDHLAVVSAVPLSAAEMASDIGRRPPATLSSSSVRPRRYAIPSTATGARAGNPRQHSR